MSRRFYTAGEGQVVASRDLEKTVLDLKRVKRQLSRLEADERILSDRIRDYMGDDTTLFNTLGDRVIATWNRSEREGVNMELLKTRYRKTFEKVRTTTPVRTLLLTGE